jgi:tRNA dimethylallyltransferase
VVPVIIGPTAAGKSALAMRMAGEIPHAEIVSADSRQVYIGMDAGTAKPTAHEQSLVRHHMIDIVTPDVAYSAGQYAVAARETIRDARARGATPIVVGGSGFYIRALFEGLGAPEADPQIVALLEQRAEREGYDALVEELRRVDPVAAAAHSANNRVKTLRALACWMQTGRRYSEFGGSGALGRFELEPRYIGVFPEREELYEQINRRTIAMVRGGLVEETRRLVDRFGSAAPGLRTVGYKEAIEHLEGRIDEPAMIAAIQQSTRRYAKRQMTWFRSIRWQP